MYHSKNMLQNNYFLRYLYYNPRQHILYLVNYKVSFRTRMTTFIKINLKKSYDQTNTQEIVQDYNINDHSSLHIFYCPPEPTNLTPIDLWTKPAE